MYLEDKLIRKRTSDGSDGKEVYNNIFLIPAKVRNFKTVNVILFGTKGTVEYSANIKTASFTMDQIEYFINYAVEFMIERKYIKQTSTFDKQVGVTFDAFNMNYGNRVVDFVLCFEEIKSVGMFKKTHQMHYVYFHFGRDVNGFINYDYDNYTVRLAYRTVAL